MSWNVAFECVVYNFKALKSIFCTSLKYVGSQGEVHVSANNGWFYKNESLFFLI